MCSIETVYFTLNDTSVDVAKILEIIDISPFTFYQQNFFNLNFEEYVLWPLKRHFLDIETYILSHLIWTDRSFIYAKFSETSELNEVFNRLIHYMSN